ncbi:MAG TPA: S8 family serine peptidase [Steroidobacteraceae bacterium]|jgi:hypothetical protein|nr:S8 family serine peptidase [Steroidobacteraceae bacterium]
MKVGGIRSPWPLLAAAVLGMSLARGAVPEICGDGDVAGAQRQRAPPGITAYFDSLGQGRFDQRAACARWAGISYRRNRDRESKAPAANPLPARFIVFPARGIELQRLANWAGNTHLIKNVEFARTFLIVSFASRMSGLRLRELLDSPLVSYAEPDCDGPDFLTTSLELFAEPGAAPSCWQRSARASFPNDPCIEELWGHSKIGWDSTIAAHSLPRIVAILDSGIDALHEDLVTGVAVAFNAHEPRRSQGGRLNARCATSGRCFPHGTEMAGTIGGRMDNGIGVAGVAPNSRLLPIVITRVDRGMLARLSTIAAGIDAAVIGNADVINISAKWPVDSRAIAESIRVAVGGEARKRRLIVTGYATSLDGDDTVREYFPSRYRCLAGVIAAVPADMRGHELFNPKGHPDATDGRIQAPGVDILVTTTENSERGYALSGAAGASSAAAYVSGAVALVWGSPPLNTCDAQQIKRLLFCRSKGSDSTRYPWIHVDFLHELAKLGPGATCSTAMVALGCD